MLRIQEIRFRLKIFVKVFQTSMVSFTSRGLWRCCIISCPIQKTQSEVNVWDFLRHVIWEGVASTSSTPSLNSPVNTILTLILTPNKTFSSGGISKSSLSKHRYCSYLPWTYQNHHPWRPTTSPRIYHRTKVCWYISRATACPVPAITLWADILNRTNKVIMYSQVNAQS